LIKLTKCSCSPVYCVKLYCNIL